jgi:hypothetical protein
MDERDQLEALWLQSTANARANLFRDWILAATGEFAPDLSFSEGLGDDLVAYSFDDDLSAWQVAVAASVFFDASPDRALGVGDALVEISHLFGEEQEEAEEEAEFEEEDESAEGGEAAWDAWVESIEAAIEELEEERSSLEALMDGASPDDAAALQSMVDFLDDLLEGLRDRLPEAATSL